MPRPLAPLAAMIATAWLMAAAPAAAQTTAASATPPPSDLFLDWLSGWNRDLVVSGDATRIALDPETGTWGPAPVDRALRTSGIMPAPLIVHHPNGMIETILDPGIVDYLVVRLGPDGRPAFDCRSGADPTPAVAAPAVSGNPDR